MTPVSGVGIGVDHVDGVLRLPVLDRLRALGVDPVRGAFVGVGEDLRGLTFGVVAPGVAFGAGELGPLGDAFVVEFGVAPVVGHASAGTGLAAARISSVASST